MEKTTEDLPLELGDGIYTVPSAWRLLSHRDPAISMDRVRHWLHTEIVPTPARGKGYDLLTFRDLVSLEVTRQLVRAGASLQAVRGAAALLRHEYSLDRPLAYDVLYTHRDKHGRQFVWASADGEHFTEVIGNYPKHQVMQLALETFAERVEFTGKHEVARLWELTDWIVIDPSIQAGMPVVRDTRITVATLAANLEVGSAFEVADWYGLPEQSVLDVQAYLAAEA